MKGRIGKYKDKIVVWGDPNLTANNEINIDSLGEGGGNQTGDSESMNYYILKEDLDFSLSYNDFRNELYNKTKDKTIPALLNITDESELYERIRNSFSDVKCIENGSEGDPVLVMDMYFIPMHEMLSSQDLSSTSQMLLVASNNNRYIYVRMSDGLEIGGAFPTSGNGRSGILCFSTPKVIPLCYGWGTSVYLTGQLINPIEELYDKEVLNAGFKKVSFAEYYEFTQKVLSKAFTE